MASTVTTHVRENRVRVVAFSTCCQVSAADGICRPVQDASAASFARLNLPEASRVLFSIMDWCPSWSSEPYITQFWNLGETPSSSQSCLCIQQLNFTYKMCLPRFLHCCSLLPSLHHTLPLPPSFLPSLLCHLPSFA